MTVVETVAAGRKAAVTAMAIPSSAASVCEWIERTLDKKRGREKSRANWER
jgi:hypothetical protein